MIARLLAIFILLAAMFVGAPYYLVSHLDYKKAESEFSHVSATIRDAFTAKVADYFDIFYATKAFFDSSTYVDRGEFKSFTRFVFEKDNAIEAFEWVPRTTYEDLESIKLLAHEDGFTDFDVKERNDAGELVSVSKRDVYFPVYYLEPLKGNEKVLGFDLFSHPNRKDALEKAIALNDFAITKPVKLMQADVGDHLGFLSFLPVYNKTGSEESKIHPLKGLVLGVFNFNKLAEEVYSLLNDFDSSHFLIRIYDVDEKGKETLAYANRLGDWNKFSFFERSHDVRVGHRYWRIVTRCDEAFLNLHTTDLRLASILIGLLMTGLMTFLYFLLKSRNREVEIKVKEQTVEIRQTLNFLDSVLENLPSMVFVKDANDLRFVRINKAGSELLGIKSEDLIGKTDYDFFPKEQADFFTANDRKVLQGEDVVDIPEESIKTAKGDRILHTKKIPILDSGGKASFLLGISEDITEQKKYQDELSKAYAKAESANEARAQFLANMSHEIRTPMNGILGASDLMLQMEIEEKPKEYAGIINHSARSLLVIINDILDLSKIDSGKMTIEKISFSIQRVVEDVIQLLTSSAEEKDVTLSADIKDCHEKLFLGDPTRIRQILLNLTGNAIKFTQFGSVEVSVRTERVSPSDNKLYKVIVSVKDTGAGIGPQNIENLFKAFVQEDDAISRKYGGTGLGLTISKKLANMMGGDIKVDSELGKGSTFTVDMELEATTEKYVVEEDKPENLKRNYGKKIILAEDNKVNQQLAVDVLKRIGVEAKVAENGKAAVEMLKAGDYDLILMDMQMPVMDGLTATRSIRRFKNGKSDITIVAMTANAGQEHKELCEDAGMNGYITKPFMMKDLVHELDKWFK